MKSGRPVSFWLSHVELADLQKVADQLGCSRNEACRRAIREFVYDNKPDRQPVTEN